MSFDGHLSLYHVDCDLRHVRCAHLGTVGALARAHLNARRQGIHLRALHASPALRELVAFAGLDDVLLGRDGRQTEEREETVRVEEGREADDPSV